MANFVLTLPLNRQRHFSKVVQASSVLQRGRKAEKEGADVVVVETEEEVERARRTEELVVEHGLVEMVA